MVFLTKVRKNNENAGVNIDVMRHKDKNSSSSAVFSDRKPVHFITKVMSRMPAKELSGYFTLEK